MTYNVHPYPIIQSSYNSAKNGYDYQQSSYNPGMTVKQLWLGQILASMAANPATMLDPETHVDYAIKLVELAYVRMPG